MQALQNQENTVWKLTVLYSLNKSWRFTYICNLHETNEKYITGKKGQVTILIAGRHQRMHSSLPSIHIQNSKFEPSIGNWEENVLRSFRTQLYLCSFADSWENLPEISMFPLYCTRYLSYRKKKVGNSFKSTSKQPLDVKAGAPEKEQTYRTFRNWLKECLLHLQTTILAV